MSHYCHTCSSAGQCGHAAYSTEAIQPTPSAPPSNAAKYRVTIIINSPTDRLTLAVAVAQILWWCNGAVISVKGTLSHIENVISKCSYLPASQRSSKVLATLITEWALTDRNMLRAGISWTRAGKTVLCIGYGALKIADEKEIRIIYFYKWGHVSGHWYTCENTGNTHYQHW